MKQLQKYKEPFLITQNMLKNGWQENGNSFYCISGSMLILHLTIRKGTIGAVGTEILRLPFTCTQTWSPNLSLGNGDIVLNEDGTVKILTEVVNPIDSNINVDLITILK